MYGTMIGFTSAAPLVILVTLVLVSMAFTHSRENRPHRTEYKPTSDYRLGSPPDNRYPVHWTGSYQPFGGEGDPHACYVSKSSPVGVGPGTIWVKPNGENLPPSIMVYTGERWEDFRA